MMSRTRDLWTVLLALTLGFTGASSLEAAKRAAPVVFRFETLMHRRPAGTQRAYRWVVRVTNAYRRTIGPFALRWDAPGVAPELAPEGPKQLPRLAPGQSVTLETARFFEVYRDLRLQVLGPQETAIGVFRKILPIVPARSGPPPMPDAGDDVPAVEDADLGSSFRTEVEKKKPAKVLDPAQVKSDAELAAFRAGMPKFPEGMRILVGEYTGHRSYHRGLRGARNYQVKAKAANFDYKFSRHNATVALDPEDNDAGRDRILRFDQYSDLDKRVLYFEITGYDPEDVCNLEGRVLGVGVMPKHSWKLFRNKAIRAEVFTPVERIEEWVKWQHERLERKAKQPRRRRRGLRFGRR